MQVIDEKYEVLSKLGVGGQGTVYKARHSLLGDYRALKLIADELADNPEFVDRFRAEAQTMARFKHEHIVRVHDLINRSGRPYCLVLDFVDGPNLTEYLQQHGALAPRDALEVGRQLASALEHAHAFRVWHRDVKPRNVLIASDRPWRVLLTDFGIAKDQEAGDRTKTGHALFTTRYSAPEQLGWKRRRGRERTKVVVDQRTDIFGFGLVMFEMIEGRQFFAEMELADVMAWVLNRDADPIPLGATVPPAVARLVERALSRDPDERQPSMTEVLREIESAQRLVGLPRDDRYDRDDVTVVIPHRVDPEESSDVSDDQLDLQIQRLERERLRREAQRARDRAEAARERAHTVAAEELAADRYREGVAVEHRAIEAWDLSRYDEARQLFEQVTEALERAAAEARTEGVRREATAAAAVAGMARRTAEDAEAPARAAASFAAGVAAVSRADEQCAAGVHAAGVQDYATARRCFEQACAEAVETARVAAEVAVAAVLAARDGADAQRAPELAAEVYGAGEAAWCRAQDLQHERRHRGAEVALADACRLFDEASSVARERTRQADEARRLEERRRHEEREAAAARVAEAARQAEEVRRVEEARAAVSRRHAELEAAAQRQKDEAEARATQEAARKATPDRTVFIDRNAVPQTRIEVRRPVPTGSSDDDQTQVVPGELGDDEVVPPPLRPQGPGRSGWGISGAAVAVVVALAATAAWYFRFGAPPWLPAPTPPTQAPTVQPAPTAAPPTSLPPPAALQWQSVTPAADVRVMVKEGAAVEFTAQVQHPEQHPTISVGWQMDGQPVGSGARWTYQPSPSDGGKTKRVEVVATDGTAELRQQWDVAVANANRPPALATATPPGDLN